MAKLISLFTLVLLFLGANAQSDNQLSMAVSSHTEKTGAITGTVTTTDGLPAAQVTVAIRSLNKATITDEYGTFHFYNLKPGSYTLHISTVGLKNTERAVEVEEAKTASLSLQLAEDAKLLSAVVISSQKSGNEKVASIGKIAIDPMDLPQSIAVIGQGTIRDQQALRLSDVVKNVNGVYLGTARGSTQEAFYARGYSFSSGNLFKNGARVNSGAMPEMSSLEKVEVLKGSAAILYGNVAPGGILNMVTKQPKNHFGGEVSLRAGSFGLLKPSFDVYGPLSAALSFRVNGTYEQAESFRDGVSSKRYYVNPSLLLKLSPRTELLLQGDYLKHDFTPDFGIGSLDNTKIAPLPRHTFLGTPWAYASTDQATASAQLKHTLSEGWKVTGQVSYQNYKRDYYSTERIQADKEGKWKRTLGRTNTAEDYFTGQVDLNGKFNTGSIQHTLLAGVDADRYFITNYTFNQPAIYDSINILNPTKYQPRTDMPVVNKIRRIQTPTNRGGAYIQDLISLSSKVKLLAGVRYSYQRSMPADSLNLLTKAQSSGKSKSDQAFSPRVGLVYRPFQNTSLFASYANSFTVNSGTDVYGNGLQPSIIDQYEVGAKNDFFGGKLSANLTLYRIINNNLAQTAQFLADGTTINTNTSLKELTGQTTSDGVEIDLSGHPLPGLDVIAGYSYNYMRYTKTPDAKGNYVEGERLVNTPAHTANTSLFYTIPSGRMAGLKLGAAAFYTGSRWGGWNNTIGQAQAYSRLIPVSPFTTVDISAGYRIKNFSLLAKVSNLTNTLNYYVHENYSINPIPPRQFVTSLTYKF